MNNAVAIADQQSIDISVVEAVITGGDLGKLSPEMLVRYYIQTCESVGLNWRTKPFDVVSLRGSAGKTLYANKGCAEQLAKVHHINVEIINSEVKMGIAIDTARACTKDGRCVTKKGAVPIEGLKGDNLANAIMKVETKAHRRAVLALVGLNMLDETEASTVPDTTFFNVDVETGEIHDAPETRQNAPGRTETPRNEPTPIAEGNKASKGQINRIVALFDELKYQADQRRPTLAQLVSQPDPTKLTKAQAEKVIAALDRELWAKMNPVSENAEAQDRDQDRDQDVIDVDWSEVTKPDIFTDEEWENLNKPTDLTRKAEQ
jgi:hypothetical protein